MIPERNLLREQLFSEWLTQVGTRAGWERIGPWSDYLPRRLEEIQREAAERAPLDMVVNT